MTDRKVDFIIIGAQKCGTTSLASKLKEHPDVCFCDIKEPNYFRVSYRKTLESYHALFHPEPGQILGEASVRYTYDSIIRDVPKQMFTYNPNLKLIYIMRHPIERIMSLYNDFQIRGENVNENFFSEVIHRHEYLNMTHYYAQIKPYLRYFNRDQFLFLKFENLVNNPELLYTSIAEFLDIDFNKFELKSDMQKNKSKNILYSSHNSRKLLNSGVIQVAKGFISDSLKEKIRVRFYKKTVKPTINELQFQYIMSFLDADIDKMEQLLNWDLSSWREFGNYRMI